jgi:hypothetical protein
MFKSIERRIEQNSGSFYNFGSLFFSPFLLLGVSGNLVQGKGVYKVSKPF